MTNLVNGRRAGPMTMALVGLVAFAGNLDAQGLIVSGYGDIEWTFEDRGGEDGWKNAFDNHHLNLILLGSIVDDLIVGAEVEYEHAGEEIALEYAYLAYTGIPGLRIAGGKFIIPFNRFNKDVHPTWISRMPGRPLVYGNVFPTTYSDVGLWVSGGMGVGDRARVVYDAYLVNGLEGDPDESDFRALRDNDRERPRRGNDKALGARLGIELPFGLGAGVSGYTGEYAADEATDNGLRVTFFGADVDYSHSGLDLRAELVSASQDLTNGETNNRTGFYAQAAYEINRFEPVVRFSWVDFEEDAGDTHELGLGANYYVSSSAAVRLAYFVKLERHGDAFKTDNNQLIGQFVVAF